MRKASYRKGLVFLLAGAFSLGPAFGQQIVMSAIDYPPYTIPAPSGGTVGGLASEIAVEAGRAAGIDVRVEIVPMARAGRYIAERKHQALLGLVDWVAAENLEPEAIDILNLGFVFYYKKSRFPAGLAYTALEELRPYRIGNIRGSSTVGILEGAGLTLQLYTDLAQAFRNLDADRVDAVVGGDLSGQLIIRQLFPEKLALFSNTREAFYARKVSIILRKEDAALITGFREGLRLIVKNGTYQAIVGKYCPPGTSPQELIPQEFINVSD